MKLAVTNRYSTPLAFALLALVVAAMIDNISVSGINKNDNDFSGHVVGVANALSPTVTPNHQGKKRWLVVDFDGTCTARDTTPLLPRLACLVQSQQQQQQQTKGAPTAPTSNFSSKKIAAEDWKERRPVFVELEQEYFRRYVKVLESIDSDLDKTRDQKKRNQQKPQHQTQLLERLEISLDRLDVVSTEITERVTQSAVLRGLGSVTHLELLRVMQRHDKDHSDGDAEASLRESLRLHPGCLSVLRQCATRHSIGVLSINWCPALIQAVLVHPLCDSRSAQNLHGDDDDDNNNNSNSGRLPTFEEVPVWSNSVDHHGAVSLHVPGAIAKKERILRLQQQQQQQHSESTPLSTETAMVVYVGDSSTDLLALLQADVGILIGRSESTIGLASKFGVDIRPLGEFRIDNDDDEETECATSSNDNAGVVWLASDWNEIGSFMNQFFDSEGSLGQERS